MKKIIAVNASPRTGWNTSLLVNEAAKGAASAGAEIEVIDLYKLDKFSGCISCFGCKREASYGRCACRDGLTPVLDKIRNADGLIIGTPNYLGEGTAGFRALYERLVFQVLTYNREQMCCNEHPIPVLLIMTSNAPDQMYAQLLKNYEGTLSNFVGPTTTFACGDTLQVNDYSNFNWTLFDPAAKQARRETDFPQKMAQVFDLGAALVSE